MTSDRDLLAVGKIVKASGLRGDVIVQSMTDSPARFRQLRNVLMGKDPESVITVEIEAAAVGSRGVRVRIAGVADRTAAEQTVGNYLFVDEEHRVRIPRGRFFVHEIIGMTVIDQDGKNRGVVKDVLKLPAHDVYVVECNSREFMLPAAKE
ncbi:MAG: 16S rRNA processing protein RimM, partial [Bacteroidetes bacterium]|nr:16S rRNA processing protein RimM [Bacteroidota bacterium]